MVRDNGIGILSDITGSIFRSLHTEGADKLNRTRG